jgi:hypothetical protein
MPFYVVALPKNINNTFTAFLEQGISDQMPGQVSDIIISGVPAGGTIAPTSPDLR